MRSENKIEALVYSFRRGRDAYPRDVIVVIPGVSSSKVAHKFVSKKVVWMTRSGESFVGVVMRAWGRNGHLLVRFRRPLPGQALGTKCYVILS